MRCRTILLFNFFYKLQWKQKINCIYKENSKESIRYILLPKANVQLYICSVKFACQQTNRSEKVVTFVLQGGQQTKCTLPEVLGNGPLDLRVHGETEIFAQAVKNCGDEKEAEGDRKQTSQHHRVSCPLIRFYWLSVMSWD